MLSWSCRRFRARFTPGSRHPHRRACSECEAFAAAMERAAGTRLPLPPGLRRGLREIAAPAGNAVLPFAVPRLPLPAPLASRLRTLGPPAPDRTYLPEWVRSPFYAVAASALLALLLGPLLTEAAGRGLQTVGAVREEVSPLLHRTGEDGREEIDRLRAGVAEAYDAAHRSAAKSLRRLDAGVDEITSWLSTVAGEESTNRDPRGEAAGSTRRP